MTLEMRRVILFARHLPTLATYYRDVLGLTEKPSADDPRTWREFDAGGCSIALHNGGALTSGRPPKIVFYVPDVTAARAELNARGANFGRITTAGEVQFCNGTDAEGNVLSLSNRP